MDEIVGVFVLAMLVGVFGGEKKRKNKSGWQKFKESAFSPLALATYALCIVVAAILIYITV